jgi:hypothetical protein
VGVGSGSASGSGWVAVISVERGGQGGSNGGSGNVGVAVLAEIWWFECEGTKNQKKKVVVAGMSWECSSGSVSGSGWVAVVSYDAAGHGGSNGGSGSVGVAVLREIGEIKDGDMGKI